MRSPRFPPAVTALLAVVIPCVDTVTAVAELEWDVVVNLGATINTRFSESGPAISANGLTLYLTSDRPGGSGAADLWVTHRTSQTATWGAPVNLGGRVNSAFVDRNPALSPDGRTMFFASERPGGHGDSDVWVTRRADDNNDFGWQAPINLGPTINTAGREAGPTYLEHAGRGDLYFVSIRGGNDGDIYVSAMSHAGTFDRPRLVAELNSAWGDARPAIRRDGLEIFFQSFRRGSLGGCRQQACFDLWVSRRTTRQEQWSHPANVVAINTRFAETDAAISSDGDTLFFASDRPGGYGATDLYLSKRAIRGGER